MLFSILISCLAIPVHAGDTYVEPSEPVYHALLDAGYPDKSADLYVKIDTDELENISFIQIDIAETDENDSGVLKIPYGYSLGENLEITFRGEAANPATEHIELIRDHFMATGVDYKGKRYFTETAEFNVKKPLPTGSSLNFKFRKIPVSGVSSKVPVFVTLEDNPEMPDTIKKYVSFIHTYPELVYGVKIENKGGGNFYLSWDPIFKFTKLFENYEISIKKKSSNTHPCEMENPLFNQQTKVPYVTLSLPENEEFVTEIKVHQAGITNFSNDCGTKYYLYTPNTVGAIVPLIPVAKYRTDYEIPESYLPPQPSPVEPSPGYVPQEDKIQEIEEKLAQLEQEQEDVQTKQSEIETQVEKHKEKITFLEKLIQKIMTLVKNIFPNFF